MPWERLPDWVLYELGVGASEVRRHRHKPAPSFADEVEPPGQDTAPTPAEEGDARLTPA